VLLYGRLELVYPLARVAAGHDYRGEPRLGVELLTNVQYGVHLVRRPLGLRVVCLVYAEDVGYLHDPGLERLHRIPCPRLKRQYHRVRRRGDLDLPLPHPDRLVQDHVHPGGLHRQGR
jgi:hypothetical protein